MTPLASSSRPIHLLSPKGIPCLSVMLRSADPAASEKGRPWSSMS
jgi:hypothetical protein